MRRAALMCGVLAAVMLIAAGCGGRRMERLEDRLRAYTRVDEWVVGLDGAWIETTDELVVTGLRKAVRRERNYDGIGTLSHELTPSDGAPFSLAMMPPSIENLDHVWWVPREVIDENGTDWQSNIGTTGRLHLPAWSVRGSYGAAANAIANLGEPGMVAVIVIGRLDETGRGFATPLNEVARRAGIAGPIEDPQSPRGSRVMRERIEVARATIAGLPPGDPTAIRFLLLRWPPDAPWPRLDLYIVEPPTPSTFAIVWRRFLGALAFWGPFPEPVALLLDGGTIFFSASGSL